MSDSEDEPTSESDWPVSAEWLQNILRSHHADLEEDPAITIMDFSVRPGCEPSESVLSHIVAVSVQYCIKNDGSSNTHNLRLIVKMLPQDPFSRFFVTEAQFDLREIKFYTEVIPDLERFRNERLNDENDDVRLPIPKCYYGHYFAGTAEPEPSPPESVLVLENVKTCGYVGSDFSRGLTLRQTRAAVEAIAEIHALSLAYKIREAKNLTDKYGFLFQTTRASDSYQQLIERGLPQLSQFLEMRPGLADILAALNELRPHTKRIIESLLAPEEPMALITHTDFWCNNLMFKEDDDSSSCRCSILDWQMVTYSRATNDLALLLVSSVPAELRRLHTERLLDTYWDVMVDRCSRYGVNIEGELEYDRRRLSSDYKRSQLLALLLCIGSVDLALGNAQMEERLLELLQDLHGEGLLCVDVVTEK